MSEDTKQAPEDIVQDATEHRLARAIVVTGLQGEAEAAVEYFEYDEDPVLQELVRLCRQVLELDVRL